MSLTSQEIEHFKKRLIEMRAQITNSLRVSSKEVKSSEKSSGYSQHQADEGTDDFDRTVTLELTTQEYNLLKQIDRALEKIDENTYGICDVTEKPIPIKRLEAIPYATMTVQAQQQLEKGLL